MGGFAIGRIVLTRIERSTAAPAATIVLLGILCALGCSERPAVNRDGGDTADPSRPGAVRIVFRLPGDDIGAREDREILGAIRDEIVRRDAGSVVSSGYGMGSMELVIEFRDGASADSIREIVDGLYPGARYRIERRTQ